MALSRDTLKKIGLAFGEDPDSRHFIGDFVMCPFFLGGFQKGSIYEPFKAVLDSAKLRMEDLTYTQTRDGGNGNFRCIDESGTLIAEVRYSLGRNDLNGFVFGKKESLPIIRGLAGSFDEILVAR